MFDFKEAKKKNEEAIKRGGIYIVKDELSVMLTARFFSIIRENCKALAEGNHFDFFFFFGDVCHSSRYFALFISRPIYTFESRLSYKII